MLPPEVGVPVVRRELDGGRRGRRGRRRRRARRAARRAPPDRRARRRARHGRRGAHGADDRAHRRADGRRRPERAAPSSTRPPAPSSTTTASTAPRCCPGVMGMEGFAEAARALLPGWERRRARGRRAAGAVQVLPRRAAHARAARAGARRRRRHARGRLPADRAARRCPARTSRRRVHFTGRARLAREAPGAADRDGPAGATAATASATTRSTASTSTAPPTRCSTAPGATTATSSAGCAGDLPADHEPPSSPTEFVPAPDRAVLPDRRRVGARHRRAGWRCRPTSSACVRYAGADAPGALWAVVTPRADGDGVDAEVVDESGSVRVRLEGYRTVELPGGVDARRARADPRRDGRLTERMPRPFSRLAIVNRGEPAMRAHPRRARAQRAARRADPRRSRSTPRPSATRCSCATPTRRLPRPGDGGDGHRSGYLDHDALERALVAARADAAWVGWGFVAEHPEFADLCERLGIVFVGPDADVMRLVGDKIAAKRLAEEAGVPVAPVERRRRSPTVEDALAPRATHRLPADDQGGGGRRRPRHPPRRRARRAAGRVRERARRGAARPSATAPSSWSGSSRPARHVEVQVIADGQGAAWAVGVRDCSLPAAQPEGHRGVRQPGAHRRAGARGPRRGAAARAARRLPQRRHGRVPLRARDRGASRSWRSTRACRSSTPSPRRSPALDLVKLQLHVAAGGRLEGEPPPPRGHAVEARLNAEDPALGFAARARADRAAAAARPGPGVRVDTGVAEGDVIPAEFDSMIAKVIAWGADRDEALARLRRALAETTVVVDGGTTNQGFLLELLDRPEVRSGDVDTDLAGPPAARRRDRAGPPRRRRRCCRRRSSSPRRRRPPTARASTPSPAAGARRPTPTSSRTVDLRHRGQAYRLRGRRRSAPGRYRVTVDGAADRGRGRSRVGALRAPPGAWTAAPTARSISVQGARPRSSRSTASRTAIARDDGGLVRNLAPAVVVAIPVARRRRGRGRRRRRRGREHEDGDLASSRRSAGACGRCSRARTSTSRRPRAAPAARAARRRRRRPGGGRPRRRSRRPRRPARRSAAASSCGAWSGSCSATTSAPPRSSGSSPTSTARAPTRSPATPRSCPASTACCGCSPTCAR